MDDLIRRIRGLLGVGFTWGTLWAVIGAIIGTIIVVVGGAVPWGLGHPVVEWAIGMGLYGFVSGVGFGTLLSLKEGRKRLLDLSLPRVAAWGVLGSALVPFLFGYLGMFEAGTTLVDVLQAVGVTALLGGTFAPGAVAIARRAALTSGDPEPELLAAVED